VRFRFHGEYDPGGTEFTAPDGKKLIFTQYDAASNANAWEVSVTGDATPIPLKALGGDGRSSDQDQTVM
jgi:hypothetical protein